MSLLSYFWFNLRSTFPFIHSFDFNNHIYSTVYSVPKIDNEDISMQQLMEKMKKEMPGTTLLLENFEVLLNVHFTCVCLMWNLEDSEETAAILHKLADMFDSLEFDLDDLTSSTFYFHHESYFYFWIVSNGVNNCNFPLFS